MTFRTTNNRKAFSYLTILVAQVVQSVLCVCVCACVRACVCVCVSVLIITLNEMAFGLDVCKAVSTFCT